MSTFYNFLHIRYKTLCVLSKRSKQVLGRQKAGFTIVELLVTLGIVVLVTGLIMVRYSSFNNSVLLKNQAYFVAFDLREAQSLAVSVRGRSGEFREEYGLYFSLENNNQYILFQDDNTISNDDPVRYNEGEEVGEPVIIDPRFVLVNICVNTFASRICSMDDPKTTDESINESLSDVAISFQRPDFDGVFYTAGVSNIQSAEVFFAPVSDATFARKVQVYATGQISVE